MPAPTECPKYPSQEWYERDHKERVEPWAAAHDESDIHGVARELLDRFIALGKATGLPNLSEPLQMSVVEARRGANDYPRLLAVACLQRAQRLARAPEATDSGELTALRGAIARAGLGRDRAGKIVEESEECRELWSVLRQLVTGPQENLGAFMDAMSEVVREITKPKPNPNDERDKFIYEQMKGNVKLVSIKRKILDHADWSSIENDQGVSQAAMRYAKRRHLSWPIKRKLIRHKRNKS